MPFTSECGAPEDKPALTHCSSPPMRPEQVSIGFSGWLALHGCAEAMLELGAGCSAVQKRAGSRTGQNGMQCSSQQSAVPPPLRVLFPETALFRERFGLRFRLEVKGPELKPLRPPCPSGQLPMPASFATPDKSPGSLVERDRSVTSHAQCCTVRRCQAVTGVAWSASAGQGHINWLVRRIGSKRALRP